MAGPIQSVLADEGSGLFRLSRRIVLQRISVASYTIDIQLHRAWSIVLGTLSTKRLTSPSLRDFCSRSLGSGTTMLTGPASGNLSWPIAASPCRSFVYPVLRSYS